PARLRTARPATAGRQAEEDGHDPCRQSPSRHSRTPLRPPRCAAETTVRPVRRWERNAEFWIRIIRERLDPFRTEVTDAAVLRALGPCADRSVLDAGCGEGYLTRRLAGRGAAAVGVDRAA